MPCQASPQMLGSIAQILPAGEHAHRLQGVNLWSEESGSHQGRCLPADSGPVDASSKMAAHAFASRLSGLTVALHHCRIAEQDIRHWCGVLRGCMDATEGSARQVGPGSLGGLIMREVTCRDGMFSARLATLD